jgi:hypothetical protein
VIAVIGDQPHQFDVINPLIAADPFGVNAD